MVSQSIIRLSVVLALAACGGPPASLSIDPLFSELQRSVIVDARDAWCEKRGWCPSWSADGEAHIQLIRGEMAPPETVGAMGETPQSDDKVMIEESFLLAFPEGLWMIVAHEMGHLQDIPHHGPVNCLMSAGVHVEPIYELSCE